MGAQSRIMIVGILSDTHDRIDATAAAVKTLTANGAEFLIHCGDVGSDPILDQLAGIPSAFVWGNNDFDRRGLQSGTPSSWGSGAWETWGSLNWGKDVRRAAWG